MDIHSKALDVLIQKIVAIIDSKIANLKFDTTFTTTVWNKNDDGTYQITYMGQKYNVPNISGIPLTTGQTVWVTIPKGVFRNMYICGAKKEIHSSAGSGGGGTVNDGRLTITQNGTNAKTFTANQSSSVTVDIVAPVTRPITKSEYLSIQNRNNDGVYYYITDIDNIDEL